MRILNRCATLAVAASLGAGPALEAQVWEVANEMLRLPIPQDEAQFGNALAIGDFDGNGVNDLAVGAPLWDSATVDYSGVVRIYWGSIAGGLVQGPPLTFGTIGPFGAGDALAAGDFDGDGRDELAVGAPMTGVGAADYAGIVVVWEYESGWSLCATVSQADSSYTGPEDFDAFGRTLAVGDFNGDQYDDLAVGVPSEDWDVALETGVVHVFYGSAAETLRTDNDTGFRSPVDAAYEEFGSELAAGDFDDDGHDDLAVGIPSRTVLAHSDAGAVEIYSGSAAGIVTTGPQLLQDNSFTGGAAETGDEFGAALAAANFNQGTALCSLLAVHCYDDLAIGVPGQLRSGQAKAGKVIVAHGGEDGLSTSGQTILGASPVGATDEAGDQFGATLAAGKLDGGNLYADLAIGSPVEDEGGETDAGVVHLVFGGSSGLNSGRAAQYIWQQPGFEIGPALGYDHFGQRLAIGDLDDDGWGDLVVGVPIKESTHRGAVQVLYGALFADGFESGGTGFWEP